MKNIKIFAKNKLILIFAFVTFGFILMTTNANKVYAFSCNWVGAGSSDWSDSNNWVGTCAGGAGVPIDGDDVIITNNENTNNDIVGLTLNTLSFFGSPGGTLTGNGLGITTSITSSFPHIINVPITLEGNASFSTNAYNGTVDLNGFDLTVSTSVNPWGITSQIIGSGNIYADNSGTIYLTGGADTGTRTINASNGTQVSIGGSWPTGTTIYLTNGSTYFGPGDTDVLVISDGTGTIAPSRQGVGSPELTQASAISLDPGDTATFTIIGPTLGVDYDSIHTVGAIDISGVNLNVGLNASYSPHIGDMFVLIDSDTSLTGEFNSYPDGSQINLNGRLYTIFYTSNNVFITADSGSCIWNGSVDQFWSTPGNWDAGCSGVGGIPGINDDIFFDGVANTSNLNDIADLSINRMDFLAPNFIIVGLPLGINHDIGATNYAIISNDLTILTPFVILFGNDYGGVINFGFNDFTIDSTLRDMAIGGEFIGNAHISFTGNNAIVLTGDSPNFNSLNNITGPDVYVEADMGNTSWLVNANSSLNGNGFIYGAVIQGLATISPRDHNLDPSILVVNSNINFSPGSLMVLDVFGNSLGGPTGYGELMVHGAINGFDNVTTTINNTLFAVDTDVLILVNANGGLNPNELTDFPEGTLRNFGVNLEAHYTTTQFGFRGFGLNLTNTVFSVNPTSPNPNQDFVVTTTWVGNGPNPVGIVELFDGSTSLGTAFLSTLDFGTETFTITGGLPAGVHNLTVQYSGDFAYDGAISSPLVLGISTNSNLSNTGIDLPLSAIIFSLILSSLGLVTIIRKYK